MMGLSRRLHNNEVEEEFKEDKTIQSTKISQLLQTIPDSDILVFTDGSALDNPGPTGAGAAIYMEGYSRDPVLLHRPVSKNSNNFCGELVGIELALSFLDDLPHLMNRDIHIFTDCQAAILASFKGNIPTSKIEVILQIREKLLRLTQNFNKVRVHWVPGHMDERGNELADREAKKGAKEAAESDMMENVKKDKKEITKALKKKTLQKWTTRYNLERENGYIHGVVDTISEKCLIKGTSRKSVRALNQIISGHPRLKKHLFTIGVVDDPGCDKCGEEETIDHYLFECRGYTEERNTLERRIYEILRKENIMVGRIDLKTMVGILDCSKSSKEELVMATLDFILASKRF